MHKAFPRGRCQVEAVGIASARNAWYSTCHPRTHPSTFPVGHMACGHPWFAAGISLSGKAQQSIITVAGTSAELERGMGSAMSRQRI